MSLSVLAFASSGFVLAMKQKKIVLMTTSFISSGTRAHKVFLSFNYLNLRTAV